MPPSPAALVINAGSSSVKCALFTFTGSPREIVREDIDGAPSSCVPRVLEWADAHTRDRNLAAAGHRIVHGGSLHRRPQRIDGELLESLTRLTPFAPNHLPEELAIVRALEQARPQLPQVACFDTAFHADLPEVARRLPIPQAYDAQGVRRYGFHGLSYAFLVEELSRLAGAETAHGKLVLAHLGNGSSLAAVHGGRSVDTTMAFTPIGGVMMGTRSGDLDPGVLTHLARTEHLTPDQVEDLVSQRSGLLGVSNQTGDMRALLAREADDPSCRLAIAMYVYSVRKAIGSLAAALGGLDTLVFSGGIGEHAPAVRGRVCDGLAFLGIRLDRGRNDANAPIISRPHERVTVRVIRTDEALMIARATFDLLDSPEAP